MDKTLCLGCRGRGYVYAIHERYPATYESPADYEEVRWRCPFCIGDGVVYKNLDEELYEQMSGDFEDVERWVEWEKKAEEIATRELQEESKRSRWRLFW